MNILPYILLFFSFFPFLSFINTGTDLQPYAFITSIVIIILIRNYEIPKNFLPLLIVSLFSIFVFVAYGEFGMFEIRSLYNYLSLGIITYASYLSFKKIGLTSEKQIKIIINAWFLIGLIQKYIYPGFLLFLVPGARTSVSRGIPNLTSEPSFYGYMIMFALMFVLDFKEKRNIYIISLIIQLLFFSQSAIGILYLGIYLGLVLLKDLFTLRPRYLIRTVVIVLIVFVISYLYLNLYPNSRASTLLVKIIQNPLSVYNTDQSVNDRFNHIYNPVMYSIKSFFLPNGYNKASILFNYTRIMSGYGASIFELGFMGIFMIFSIFTIINNTKMHNNHRINSIFITIILFSAIQIASPILALYLGYLLNLESSSNDEDNVHFTLIKKLKYYFQKNI